MLKRLLIENYALIDHLDILFPGGLVIITGETGAGKSILLGALSLVLGGRSDVSVLQDPARNCVVEAVFEEEGSERIFRRVVTPQGRSRGFIDDEPASVEMLRAAAGRLVDVPLDDVSVQPAVHHHRAFHVHLVAHAQQT